MFIYIDKINIGIEVLSNWFIFSQESWFIHLSMPKAGQKKEKKCKGEASLDVGRSFVKDVTESNIWDFTPRCRLSQPCQQVLHMDKGTDVTVRRISKENHNFLRNFFPGKWAGPNSWAKSVTADHKPETGLGDVITDDAMSLSPSTPI